MVLCYGSHRKLFQWFQWDSGNRIKCFITVHQGVSVFFFFLSYLQLGKKKSLPQRSRAVSRLKSCDRTILLRALSNDLLLWKPSRSTLPPPQMASSLSAYQISSPLSVWKHLKDVPIHNSCSINISSCLSHPCCKTNPFLKHVSCCPFLWLPTFIYSNIPSFVKHILKVYSMLTSVQGHKTIKANSTLSLLWRFCILCEGEVSTVDKKVTGQEQSCDKCSEVGGEQLEGVAQSIPGHFPRRGTVYLEPIRPKHTARTSRAKIPQRREIHEGTLALDATFPPGMKCFFSGGTERLRSWAEGCCWEGENKRGGGGGKLSRVSHVVSWVQLIKGYSVGPPIQPRLEKSRPQRKVK